MHIKVKVVAAAKKEKIELKNGSYLIETKAPAKQNLANQRVRELLAEIYSINIRKVKLVSGHHSPRKTFDISLEA